MKKYILLVFLFLFSLTQFSCAAQQQGPIETFAKGCELELETYCSKVVPGEGRLLACLYAHSDKVSGRCEFAVYDAAVQLQRVIAGVAYLANECRDDLEKFCADVQMGEGRVIDCMEKNSTNLSPRCKQAFDDVSN